MLRLLLETLEHLLACKPLFSYVPVELSILFDELVVLTVRY